jgi:hypothetical protein
MCLDLQKMPESKVLNPRTFYNNKKNMMALAIFNQR